jgi:hypothetical protein
MGDICWPEGRQFAFTIVDDTDFSTLRSTKPVYDFLADCGILTTKTVWPLSPARDCVTGGMSLEDRDYREWIQELQQRGVEIALHGVADGTSDRNRISLGLARFRSVLGHEPSIHTNHVAQGEALYWGPRRLDAPLDWLYRGYCTVRTTRRYDGAVPASDHFWGDLCRTRIKYVRNLVFEDINTLKMDPLMPYHDPRRPYVRYWFSASNGSGPEPFCNLISEANQDRLEQERGGCIVYTHFGNGFHPLPADFRRLIERLSRKPGWFVPASRLLDYVGAQRGWLSAGEQPAAFTGMQWRWALEKTVHALRKARTAPKHRGPAKAAAGTG